MGEAEVGGGGAAGDKGPGEAATSPAEETVVWSPEVEVCLFHAMLGHKPVGVNRHFHMICIRDKFSQNIGRQVPSKVIWDHLSTMYDMQALHESEILPFPNPERNFVLPEEIIQEVREGKVIIEEEMKEEMKEDVDPHNGADDEQDRPWIAEMRRAHALFRLVGRAHMDGRAGSCSLTACYPRPTR
nr:MRG/MORF4L-binding protein isoform X2 [Equus asinus]